MYLKLVLSLLLPGRRISGSHSVLGQAWPRCHSDGVQRGGRQWTTSGTAASDYLIAVCRPHGNELIDVHIGFLQPKRGCGFSSNLYLFFLCLFRISLSANGMLIVLLLFCFRSLRIVSCCKHAFDADDIIVSVVLSIRR